MKSDSAPLLLGLGALALYALTRGNSADAMTGDTSGGGGGSGGIADGNLLIASGLHYAAAAPTFGTIAPPSFEDTHNGGAPHISDQHAAVTIYTPDTHTGGFLTNVANIMAAPTPQSVGNTRETVIPTVYGPGTRDNFPVFGNNGLPLDPHRLATPTNAPAFPKSYHPSPPDAYSNPNNASVPDVRSRTPTPGPAGIGANHPYNTPSGATYGPPAPTHAAGVPLHLNTMQTRAGQTLHNVTGKAGQEYHDIIGRAGQGFHKLFW